MNTKQDENLYAEIGSGLDGYRTITSDGRRLTWTRTRAEQSETIESTPTPHMWASFWDTLNQLNAWAWNNHSYTTPGILDGTHWTIDLHHHGNQLKAVGANGYPGSNQPEPSPEFTILCNALSRLANGQPFA